MKDTLRNLLAEGKTAQVITELRLITKQDDELNKSVIALSARYKDFERKKLGDLEDPSLLNVELAKINHALLAMIDELKEVNSNLSKANVNNSRSPLWITWTGLNDVKSWITAFAGIAGILTFYFKYCKNVSDNKDKPFSVVVYTHGQGGRQDIISLKDTKLVADFRGRREIAKIGENGQNTFNEISTEFHNTKIEIGLQGTEGYVLSFPDSAYLLNEQPIYLEVKSVCQTCVLEGFVQNQRHLSYCPQSS